jgi:two-component system sensor histidine kinase/response regulator
LMGGDIGVESVTGEGSKFWFTVVLEQQAGSALPVTRIPIEDMDQLRVLIVDDNDTNRRIVSHNLQPWGCKFTEAEGAIEALEVLLDASNSSTPFNLVLMDYQMPGMDGAMLARKIRAHAVLADLPLILLTSMNGQGDFKRMQDLGFSGYLVKPVKPSQLFDCIALVMGSKLNDDEDLERALVTSHMLEDPDRKLRRVLLAEDNLVNQKVAVRILQKAGYRCDVAANGLEAVTAIANIDYDLVLMDCQMPEMDGYQATETIRKQADDPGRRIPIVAMTANAMEGDREACLAAGMDDYLTKPVTSDKLVHMLGRWLG